MRVGCVETQKGNLQGAGARRNLAKGRGGHHQRGPTKQ